MGFSLRDAAIIQAIEKGLIRIEDLASPSMPTALPVAGSGTAREVPELVTPSFTPPGTWVVPVVTASETNSREWRARSNRTKAARAAVSRCFGPHLRALSTFAEHFHRGGTLRVTFTRLGGRKLDASNVPAALKATEDALCLLIGADDGDSRWRPEFAQEPGGATGVRIELRTG